MEKVFDKWTLKEEVLLDKTSNSYLVSQSKLSDKGINCSNWFSEEAFKKRFEYAEKSSFKEEH